MFLFYRAYLGTKITQKKIHRQAKGKKESKNGLVGTVDIFFTLLAGGVGGCCVFCVPPRVSASVARLETASTGLVAFSYFVKSCSI